MPTAQINGKDLYYRWEGERGEPLVFLNGILMSVDSWKLQTDFFKSRYRCLLHDFRGQLRSARQVEGLTLAEHVEDLRVLLDTQQVDRCHLVGTSYGGEVGLLFASTYPERVVSLCAITCVSYSDALLKTQVALWRALAGLEPGLLFDAVQSLGYSAAFLENDYEYVAERRAGFQRLPSDFFQGFTALCTAFLAMDLTELLPQIEAPTQVIAAELDILKPPHYSKLIADSIPRADYAEIAGAGHAVVIERPSEINALVDRFLNQHPISSS